MDSSVKGYPSQLSISKTSRNLRRKFDSDQKPTEELPYPQFSFNGDVLNNIKSMNDDYEGVDPRPNLWARPDGNFAKLEFDGWNIHHTTG